MTRFEDLKHSMHSVFKNCTDEIDMDDITVMWEALILHRGFSIPETWLEFISEINVKKSDHFSHFSQIFNKHFKK